MQFRIDSSRLMQSHLPHWSAGWLHLLAKPGTTCNKPQALRPICLQHPINESILDILIIQIMRITYSILRGLPLYAYLPGRSTIDYLLFVSEHCRMVRVAYQSDQKNLDRFGLHDDFQISLNMEKN